MRSLCPIIQHHRDCSSNILSFKRMARYYFILIINEMLNVSNIDNYDIVFNDAFHMNSFHTVYQFLSYDYKQ